MSEQRGRLSENADQMIKEIFLREEAMRKGVYNVHVFLFR
jgi:hypothetical protein